MAYLLLIPLLTLIALALYISTGGPRLPRDTDAIIAGVMQSDLPEMVTGQSGYAISGELQIWYERIMPAVSPVGVVMLHMGMGGDALIWPPSFVRAFVDAGYQVVRYDYRATGMSDWMKATIADLAVDAFAVLDALDIRQAHMLGLSMGGMVAQEMAIQRPERVASLILIMTSGYVGDPDLPEMSSSYFIRSIFRGLPLFKYRILGGEKNLIKERIAKQLAARIEDVDLRETAQQVLYDLRRRRGVNPGRARVNLRGALQHQAAVTNSGSRYAALLQLAMPALVIHGTADPIFPFEHGQKLAATIRGARTLWLRGAGHVFPLPGMSTVMAKILEFLEQVG
ncbi:MAG TPA: alpha/beta hydrolase [Levilinea sp.]|nr:alpha/beta hydrolase [Levilinea sp.]